MASVEFPRFMRLTNSSLVCQHQHQHQVLVQESWSAIRYPIGCDACAASFNAGEWEFVGSANG